MTLSKCSLNKNETTTNYSKLQNPTIIKNIWWQKVIYNYQITLYIIDITQFTLTMFLYFFYQFVLSYLNLYVLYRNGRTPCKNTQDWPLLNLSMKAGSYRMQWKITLSEWPTKRNSFWTEWEQTMSWNMQVCTFFSF